MGSFSFLRDLIDCQIHFFDDDSAVSFDVVYDVFLQTRKRLRDALLKGECKTYFDAVAVYGMLDNDSIDLHILCVLIDAMHDHLTQCCLGNA